MNRPLDVKSRPQLALQSYLDALLQDATDEELLPEPPIPVPAPVVAVSYTHLTLPTKRIV